MKNNLFQTLIRFIFALKILALTCNGKNILRNGTEEEEEVIIDPRIEDSESTTIVEPRLFEGNENVVEIFPNLLTSYEVKH